MWPRSAAPVAPRAVPAGRGAVLAAGGTAWAGAGPSGSAGTAGAGRTGCRSMAGAADRPAACWCPGVPPADRAEAGGVSACTHASAHQDTAPLQGALVPPSPPTPGASPSTGSRLGRPRQSGRPQISAPPVPKPGTQHPPPAGVPTPERETGVGEPWLGCAAYPSSLSRYQGTPSQQGGVHGLGWGGG